MKKILFGISLIFMSIALILVGEFKGVLIFSEDVDSVVCTMLPIIGFLISLWGLFEKDK